MRVIAATNRDLEKAVAEGTLSPRPVFPFARAGNLSFRRFASGPKISMNSPFYFLDRFNQETGRKIRGFSAEAMECLREYRWPGNVREMKNVIERAVVLRGAKPLKRDDLILSNLATTGDSGDLPPAKGVFEPLTLDEIERRHILATLNATGWNKSKTSVMLGVERSTLDRKIRRYELVQPGSAAGAG